MKGISLRWLPFNQPLKPGKSLSLWTFTGYLSSFLLSGIPFEISRIYYSNKIRQYVTNNHFNRCNPDLFCNIF
jgi:hypothetical protein